MLWAVAVFVLLVALLIPIWGALRESPLFAGRGAVEPPPPPPRGPLTDMSDVLLQRIRVLEDEVDGLSRTVADLRDEVQDLQRLLESSGGNAAQRGDG